MIYYRLKKEAKIFFKNRFFVEKEYLLSHWSNFGVHSNLLEPCKSVKAFNFETDYHKNDSNATFTVKFMINGITEEEFNNIDFNMLSKLSAHFLKLELKFKL